MSSVSSQDYLDPQHPSYYAPRWLRDKAKLPAPEAKPEFLGRPISSPPLHDALFEEAVAEALRHPLEPEVIPEPPAFAYERDRRRAQFGVTARFAAAVGVSAIVALVFVIMVPTAQGRVGLTAGAISSLSTVMKSIKTALSPAPQKSDSSELALSEYRTILTSAGTGQPAATPEESEALLQKFVQWQQKPTSALVPISRNR